MKTLTQQFQNNQNTFSSKIASDDENKTIDNKKVQNCYDMNDAYTLTDSQLGIYLECIKEPESLMYNNPARFCFPNSMGVDAENLRKALITVIESYPFMKVHIETRSGLPVIVPNSTLSYTLSITDVGALDDEDLAKQFIQPFNLTTGPLFHFSIYQRKHDLVLMADIHHIITDGTSLSLFFNRMVAAYEGQELDPEDVDSFMLCRYGEKIKTTPDYIESKTFFDTLLIDADVDSNLTPDETDVNSVLPKSQVMHFSLKKSLDIKSLEKKIKILGLKRSALFLSAFAYTLAKTNGQQETLFCTIDNGRHVPELKNTFGMLVRTLPFYVAIDETETTESYLKSIQDKLLKCIQHDACSFVELASDYGINSDVIFVYQGTILNGITFNGQNIPMTLLKMDDNMAKLSLDVLKLTDDYDLLFEYRSDLYRTETIENFAKLMIRVLKGLLEDISLCDIALCGSEDLKAWQSFNDNPLNFDRNLTMVDLIRQQCEKTPERNAVICKDHCLTYKELDDLSERLALTLAKEGVKPETPVGIMVNRTEIFPVCTIGVLKAGGACQPLDSNYPEERLQYMLDDSGASLVIMDENLAHLLPNYTGKIIFANTIKNLPKDLSVTLTPPKAENLFTLLYTSGSTGKPKGCMLEHRNLVNFSLAFIDYFKITSEDRTWAYNSFGFDASMLDFYPYLICGACIFIVPEEFRLDLNALHTFLITNKITMADCTTQLSRQYACTHPDNPYLRVLSFGGEKIVSCAPPNYRFVNTYGPTEASIYVSNFDVDKEYTSVPIGKSFGNCDLYIVDSYKRPLPIGVPGELCIAGYPVTRGYLNRPDLTAEKYVDNPFNSTPGYEKMYLTGDVCRYLPDGNVQFNGRQDEQVKISGFRIELSEIESRINTFNGVSVSCVLAHDLPSGGKILVAYVVSDIPLDTVALDAFIAEVLPRYMVPSITMQLDAMPFNQNGKLDKRRLPEPELQVSKTEDFNRPLNRLEKEIMAIITEMTGQEAFGLEQDLVRSGLSSLSMMLLSNRIFEEFGCTLNVSSLLDGGTILTIENAILETFMNKNTSPQTVDTPLVNPVDAFPLSAAQLGVYYDAMKRPKAMLYNIPMFYTFSPKTHADALLKAVEKVIVAHPVLSSHLQTEQGVVVQIMDPNIVPNVKLTEMDETTLTSLKTSFAQPFDLFKGPLYRIIIAKTPKRVALLMDVHHIIFDGLSLSAFLDAVKTTYEGADPKPETHSFAQSIQEENRFEKSVDAKKSESYYDALLRDFESASDLPPDLSGKPEDGQLCECVTKTDGTIIEHFCRENGFTAAQLFLVATFYTTSRFTANRQVYLSMISSGREDRRFQESFGMFVKTLPLSASIQPETSVLDFIQSSGKGMHNAIDHSIYPFIKLLNRYGYIPKINYACQLGIDQVVEIEGEPILEEVLTLPLPKFNLSVHIEMRDGSPVVCIQYNNALYSQRLIQRFADALGVCVKHMIETPHTDITSISLLDHNSRAQIETFGQGEKAEIGCSVFHQCFEKQATLHPERTALIATDTTLSYKTLDENMNRVANALVKKGVKPGDRILILLPRTSHLIISMYGVMKAGAVYIPCDPHYPEERITHIATDSAAKYILTTVENQIALKTEKVLTIETLLQETTLTAPKITVLPDDPAYMIYTSGSTGKPKGVILTHKGISNYVTNHPANIHIHAICENAHTLISVTTVSFDMSLKETAVALCSGLTLVLASEEEAANPSLLADLFEKTHGDVFNATPSRMTQYIGLPSFCKALSACQVVMCGGEKYPQRLLEKLQSITKGQIFNTYGPTEITVSSNAKELTYETDVTIGRPLLNVSEFITDCDGNDLPAGVIGELYVGGAGVAKGYFNQDTLTQKSFITHQGLRVYKTGDYAKWDENGNVIILGRLDHQVKLRGLRIELGEVEKAMLTDTRVNEALVMIKEINQTEHLCAFFTADVPLNENEIKAHLAKTLTPYMIPTAYVQLETMPITPNGKIDTKAFPLPTLTKNTETVAPINKTEEQLCHIFADTLNLETVGATDSFFELGGTSLSVTNVLIDANKQGLTISYGDVFTHPTPRKLANLLKNTDLPPATESIDTFDYSHFDSLLKKNNLDAFREEQIRPLGNLLITGATGFLGIHILHNYLENESGDVFCLLRSKGTMTAKERLKAQLFYYFENSYDALFQNRIHIIEGDVTNKDWMISLENAPIHTLINCAALVKHFASDDTLEKVNVNGVKNLITFCKDKAIRLIQISTGSVAGDRVNELPSPEITLTEQQFYFGQNIDNQYVHSKFMAERLVLSAITQGLDAKIMRVGNLAPRESDGEFQINFTTNGFVGRLRAYLLIGSFPYRSLNAMVEMAPVDSTAESILKLSQAPSACCIFHPYNNHFVPLGDIILQMRRMGMTITLSEEDDFRKSLEKTQNDPEKAKALTTLLAYENMDIRRKIEPIATDNTYTTQVLYRLGFEWPMTSRYYMEQFLNALDGLGFFTKEA
ncbi:MAG: amino acid adenylation domain-containing protein [Eubacterium sp.]